MAQKKFTYDVAEDMVITGEAISGILIDCGTVKTDGVTLAPIADLNKISVDLVLERAGRKPVYMFQDYLDNVLHNLYAQTPTLELVKKPFGLTHKLKIDFKGGVLALRKGDKLTFRMKAIKTAFTALDLANSYISVETIPAVGQGTAVPVLRSVAIGNGDVNVDVNLGNNVEQVTAALDFSTTYTASTKAKFDGIQLQASGFTKQVSRELLELENIHMFDNNPESDVAQLVVFKNPNLIHNVSLRGKLDKAADTAARLLVTSWEVI